MCAEGLRRPIELDLKADFIQNGLPASWSMSVEPASPIVARATLLRNHIPRRIGPGTRPTGKAAAADGLP